MSTFSESPRATQLNLRVMGFCGADDSCAPEHLQLLSIHYPWIEWGVLFRPDLEGSPRYASMDWVNRLSKINTDTGGNMRLAGHLCGSRCQEILDGDSNFVKELNGLGFGRVQVNATKANAVTVNFGDLGGVARNIRNCIEVVPEVEFIFQLNDETKGIFDEIVKIGGPLPSNMSILQDASCGLGVLATEYPEPFSVNGEEVPCGYAGGIGPENVVSVLGNVAKAAGGKPVWIDMESSLRSMTFDKKDPTPKDAFSVEKCFACVLQGSASYNAALPVSRFTVLSV